MTLRQVCLYTSEFPPLSGGIATVNGELAIALTERGERVMVHCPHPPQEETDGINYSRVKARGTQDPDDLVRWFFAMGRATKNREDLHCVTEPAPVLALLWRVLLRRPVPANLILLLHGTEVLRWRRRKWLVRAIRALARKSRLLVPSLHVRDKLSEVLGPGFALPEVLPYAPPKFCHEKVERKQIEPDTSLTLLTVARIHPRKGQLDVVKALQKVNPALTRNLRYRIVGEVKKSRRTYCDTLCQAAEEAPFEVTMEGAKYGEDLILLYQESDLFILASHWESFGLVYLEAASFGLPILATQVGGVAEACSEGAILVEPHSENALVEGLERLLSDANLRRSLGEAGARRTRAMNWGEAASLLLGKADSAPFAHSSTR